MRESGSSTPIIMLTAREEETDKVLGLELGADDYITKPFSMRELLARVKANIRRMSMVPAGKGAAASANRMELGRVTVDTDQMAVLKDGQPLQLSQREYDLIRFLAAQPGKVFSREALMEHVWDYEGYVGDVRVRLTYQGQNVGSASITIAEPDQVSFAGKTLSLCEGTCRCQHTQY